MNGKILKVNDFQLKYGNKEKTVSVFACFKDNKYGNHYAIYTDNYESGILYYGNAHIKNNKLIIIDIKQDRKEIINQFVEETINKMIQSFEIIPISNLTGIEIITYNVLETTKDKILELDKLCIPKVKPKSDVKPQKNNNKNKSKLSIIIFVLILLAIGSIIMYVFRTEIFGVEKIYRCIITYNDKTKKANIIEEKKVLFDKKSKLTNIDTIISYIFDTETTYNDVKDNNKQYNYMPYKNGTYKYIDEDYILKIFANNTTDEYRYLKDINNVLDYYETNKYDCKLIEDEE